MKLYLLYIYIGVLSSLPTRERGLKLAQWISLCPTVTVAPYTGAWIEIRSIFVTRPRAPSRSLHGSVD
ncbi:hypothetical protein [Caproicibacterium sp. XB2]|uniref:hypothetical protein n=1 Tax=Caproicibacterium sp. XB2 TaxID=3388458 RepID=UPI003850ED3C